MSYREARYDDSQDTIGINTWDKHVEKSKSGMGSSMYAEKRAAIKNSLLGHQSQKQSPKQMKKNMASKFAHRKRKECSLSNRDRSHVQSFDSKRDKNSEFIVTLQDRED